MASFGDRDKLIETKQSVVDLVTETDKAAEVMIQATFRKLFPTHGLVTREV